MREVSAPKEHLLVVFFRDLPDVTMEDIHRKFPEAEITFRKLVMNTPIPKELSEKATLLVTFRNLPEVQDAPNLKLIHTVSAGLDHFMAHPMLTDTSIPISTSSGIHGPPIAEWTVMNWLVHSRNFIQTYEAQKMHEWGAVDQYFDHLSDQVGRRVGILGYGSIGRQIARVSAALGMTVHAYTASPRLTPESKHDKGYIVPGTGDPDGSIPVSWHHGLDKESIHSFLAFGLDHLVIAIPLTPQTTHIIGAEEFVLLAKHSTHPYSKPYVTNISRGKVIDQDALVESLKSGEISGAAVDVTDPEPLPKEHPLWDAPNLSISPHVSSLGREYFPRAIDIMRLNVDRMRRGEELVNEYKRGKGY